MLKLIDFSPVYIRFKDKTLYNDVEIEQKWNRAKDVMLTQIEAYETE
jgi:hypothetical protein